MIVAEQITQMRAQDVEGGGARVLHIIFNSRAEIQIAGKSAEVLLLQLRATKILNEHQYAMFVSNLIRSKVPLPERQALEAHGMRAITFYDDDGDANLIVGEQITWMRAHDIGIGQPRVLHITFNNRAEVQVGGKSAELVLLQLFETKVLNSDQHKDFLKNLQPTSPRPVEPRQIATPEQILEVENLMPMPEDSPEMKAFLALRTASKKP